MRKLFNLILALPFLALCSCVNDDDIPDVNIHVEYEGAQEIDGVYYVVQGEPFAITQITALPAREGKNAGILSVSYFYDEFFIGRNIEAPFGEEFDTNDMIPGPHILGLEMPIIEEGCTPATGYINMNLMVVQSEDDLPSGVTPSNSMNIKPAYQ